MPLQQPHSHPPVHSNLRRAGHNQLRVAGTLQRTVRTLAQPGCEHACTLFLTSYVPVGEGNKRLRHFPRNLPLPVGNSEWLVHNAYDEIAPLLVQSILQWLKSLRVGKSQLLPSFARLNITYLPAPVLPSQACTHLSAPLNQEASDR